MNDERFTPEEKQAIREAALLADAVWEFDAVRGMRDPRGSVEYQHGSVAVRLRRMLDGELVRA